MFARCLLDRVNGVLRTQQLWQAIGGLLLTRANADFIRLILPNFTFSRNTLIDS